MEETDYDSYLLELFKINLRDFLDGINDLSFGIYQPQHSGKINELFPKLYKRFGYFSGLLENNDCISAILERDRDTYLVSANNLSTFEFYSFGREEPEYRITFKKVDELTAAQVRKNVPQLLDHFFSVYLRKSLPVGMKSDGSSIIYDSKTDLLTEKGVHVTSPLLSHVAVYPAVSATINHYNGLMYLHVSPTTRIFSKASVSDLLKQGCLSSDKQIKFVRLDLGNKGRTAEIKEITQTTADTKISSPAFANRDFLEFARVNYPDIQVKDPKARLAIVIPYGISNPWIFSTEAMYPSFNFKTLDSIDPAFFRSLLGIIKARSLARLGNAKNFVKLVAPISTPYGVIEVDEDPLALKLLVNAPFLDYAGKIDETSLSKLPEAEEGAVFETPSISFRMSDRSGGFSEKTIYPNRDGKKANLNDLMKGIDLAPLEIESNLKLGLIIDKKLELAWNGNNNDFEKALLKGVTNSKGAYRGFEPTFKCQLKIVDKFVISDFFGEEFDQVVERINPSDYDCVLLIIPRWLKTAESSKQIYVVPKERIMQKGVPVQVIADDETRVKGSLKDKARDPFVMFGIALNIAAKPGFRLTAFSEQFAKNVIGNSVVIGYNVTRIMPKAKYVEQNAPIEELMGTTMPLVAPLFIIDNRGSRVLHWSFYLPNSEVSLFSDFGNNIFEKIDDDIENIIIHKDGPFRDIELSVLSRFNKPNRRIIPISITQSNPLRMHNALHIGIGREIQRGAFLRLDKTNFELATTTIQSWEAANWGWPRPLHIQFHSPLSNAETVKFIYHIFGLTKMHFGSQRPTRSPVSIHYANQMSTFLRALGDETPSFHQSFAKVFNEKGRMPLWFL